MFRPLTGKDPYNKKSVDEAQKRLVNAVKVIEDHFLINTFLVSERITLADLFGVSLIARAFEFLFDKEWRAEHPNITRWYSTVYNQSIYSDVAAKFNLIDEAIPNHPPKQEKKQDKKQDKPKQEQPKAAPKPKAKEPEEEDEPAPAPKPKHPLEALGRPYLRSGRLEARIQQPRDP